VVYSKYIRTSLVAVLYVCVYACVWFHTQYVSTGLSQVLTYVVSTHTHTQMYVWI
jgi:hypothetical protein